jgi:uroporphyrinogen-III synthase
VITFASSNTVRNFREAAGADVPVPAQTLLAAIGPITAQTCRELFREPDILARENTIESLVAALAEHFAG